MGDNVYARRTGRMVALVVLASVTVVAQSGPATADPVKTPGPAGPAFVDGMTPEEVSLAPVQLALDDLADRIQASTPASSGYGNIVVDAGRNALHVYWQGQIPEATTRVIDAGRRAAVKVT